MPSASVDLVVTSPPYNLGIRYSKFSDRADRAGYLHWCKTWAAEIARLLKADGSFFLNVGASPSNPMFPHEIVLELRDLFVLQNTIHWIKSISIEEKNGRIVSRGHFKPISSRRFLNDCHEYVFHFTKSGRVEIDRLALGVPYQDKSNIARWSHTSGRDRRCRGNTWFIPYETIQSRAKGAAASGDLSGRAGGVVHQAARRCARADHARSISRASEIRPSRRKTAA